MKNSTSDRRSIIFKFLSIVIWIGIWFILSLIVGGDFSPVSTQSFVGSILSYSFLVILDFDSLQSYEDCACSRHFFFLGSLLAVLASFSRYLEIFLSPIVKAVRTIPVASIVILILLWVKSKNLSIIVSSLMVFPIIYSSVLSGMKATSPLLIEAADNYSVGTKKRIRYIYLPSLFPFVETGLHSAVGLGFRVQ